jgi:hypothetical protein
VSLLLLLATIAVFGSVYSPTVFTAFATQTASTGTITKVSSGLVASDPLNQQLTMQQLEQSSYWKFSGDAASEGAPYNFYENSGGLHIGVQAINASTYAGFFAVSPDTSFVLAHVQVTAPVSTVSQGIFEAGMYLQTADGNVSYVTCTSYTTPQGTVWELVWATGNSSGAKNFKTLWSSKTGLPLTEDCTIITNGNNYLKLYLGGSLVYSSSSLALKIPEPFQIYLEPETTYAGQELYASFLNYYLISGEYVTVNGLPSSATKVELINASDGQVLASASKSGSTAKIEMGSFIFPLSAEIEALSSSNAVVSSTQGGVSLYGGDVYSSSGSATGGNVSLTIKTETLSGKALTGLYTTISNSTGQVVSDGYSPLTFSGAVSGHAYTACVSNYGKDTFKHWGNGSTNSCITETLTKGTTLTAYYST